MEVTRNKGRKICWGDGDIMAAGGLDKRTCIRATEKTRGVRRVWKWWQNTGRRRRALEDNNNGRIEADKGRTEATENGGRETAA